MKRICLAENFERVYFKLTLLLSLVVGSAVAGAGDRVGNGGDAVVCSNGVFMLDYVEEYSNNTKPELNGTTAEVVDELIKRIGQMDLVLKENVRTFSNDILNSLNDDNNITARLVSNKLQNLEDEGFYMIPIGCKIEQLIIRRDPNHLQKTEYFIRKDLWSIMSDYQRAVAIIHESLYKYYLSAQVENINSEVARAINRLLITNTFRDLSLKDYVDYLKLKNVKTLGYKLWIAEPQNFSFGYFDNDYQNTKLRSIMGNFVGYHKVFNPYWSSHSTTTHFNEDETVASIGDFDAKKLESFIKYLSDELGNFEINNSNFIEVNRLSLNTIESSWSIRESDSRGRERVYFVVDNRDFKKVKDTRNLLMKTRREDELKEALLYRKLSYANGNYYLSGNCRREIMTDRPFLSKDVKILIRPFDSRRLECVPVLIRINLNGELSIKE